MKKTNLDNLLSKEWIITNGIGGYTSSTITGANTRRYHGVLVVSMNPPTERKVMVAKVEERIIFNNREFQLSTNQYPGKVYPEGYRFIKEFSRVPMPTTVFEVQGAGLQKTVFMVQDSNTTVIEYTNTSNIGYQLWLNPLYAGRDYHGLLHERERNDFYMVQNSRYQVIYPYHGSEPVYFRHTAGTFVEGRTWNENLEYHVDRERGHDFREDVYSTGYMSCMMSPGAKVFLMFSTDENVMDASPEHLKADELNRLESLVPEEVSSPFLADLLVAGDQFIVQRRSTGGYSIIAGYHWFTDWGRDSMIALRGLCIATGKREVAASVIRTFLDYLQEGIIPNRFPDYKDDLPEYITIDATLWMFVAVYEYDLKFDDPAFLEEIYPKLAEIIDWHMRGTKNNIHMLENGLLAGGKDGIPLTWMDARINEYSFTARAGCAVEVNALWYNALKIMQYISERLRKKENTVITELAEKLKRQFGLSFWNADCYLNDLVTEDNEADPSIRPNQVYALSLPFPILSREQEKQVLENIAEFLVTPYGLRTLDTYHYKFKPSYSGDVWSRDAAYHQGTAWPFLLPEYFIAYLKVHDHSEEAKRQVEAQLLALKDHFYKEECIHGISEVFDGLNPLEGKGCIQQAWSVANLILLIMKERLNV
ncbi:MAG: glycogen debranching protein [Bacteroidetes bacterium]|nr:glycogen debranching protein [Bacteroidota bacterium]